MTTLKRIPWLPALALALWAQSIPVLAADPCCQITNFEPVNGVVTARVAKTAETFQFTVPARVRSHLKIGQAVELDVRARKATIPGVAGSFDVRGLRPSSGRGTANPPHTLPVETRRDDYKTAKDAECAAEGKKHQPPKQCHAEVTTTSTGSDPGDGDDQFSFTCVCT